MKRCPETPVLDSETEFTGHIWVQEVPTGGNVRFQVEASGMVTFATETKSFDAVESLPPPFQRGAQFINERVDRTALQAAADDPSTVTFCGVATWNDGVEYDWDAVPPFVGTDVWSGNKGVYLPPDAATGVFERVGLPTLPTIETERPAAHTDFTQFDDVAGFPQSAWRDGAVAGVLIRDKSGGRAVAWSPERTDPGPRSERRTAEELAATYATDERIEQTATALQNDGQSLTVGAIRDRLVSDVSREEYATLYADGAFVAALDTFRSAVAERVQEHQFRSE